MYATSIVTIGHIEFIDNGTGPNTHDKRAALCAQARAVSSVGARPRRTSPETQALVERNARLRTRLEQARQRVFHDGR